MKKIIAAVACCALFVSSVVAQEVATTVHASDSNLVLVTIQEPSPDVQPSATDVPVDAVQPAQDATVFEGGMMQSGSPSNGCGCASMVTNYAAPVASNCCCQPQPVCCPSRGSSRPQVIRGFRSRLTSMRGDRNNNNNNCCY